MIVERTRTVGDVSIPSRCGTSLPGCDALIDSVPALARRAVDLVTTGLMYMDDSSGVLGADLRALMAVHARACAAAPPDPKRLAGWLEKLRLDGRCWPKISASRPGTARSWPR